MSQVPKSFVKQLAGETAIYGLSSILSRILHYILLTVYLTRVFETQTYAIYTDMYAYAALLLIFFTFRMETAYFRFGTRKEDADEAFSSASVVVWSITFLMTMVLITNRDAIAQLLTYPDKGAYVIYFSLILALDALAAIPFAKLRLENRPLRFALIKILNVVMTIFLVFLFLEGFPRMIERGWTGLGKWYSHDSRLDLVFIANLIASAFVLILLLPSVFRVRFKVSSALRKKMIWYVLPLVVVGLAGVFNQSFAVPLLKYILPGDQMSNLNTAGLYAAAAKLALLLNLFTQAFNYAAEPFFFKRSSDQNARQVYADVAQAFGMASSIGLLGILLFLDVIVFLLGPEYRESVYIVPILLMAYWFLGLYYNFSIWYKLKDKTYVGALISLGGSVITLTIAITMIESYESSAMAWATAACYGFMSLAGYLTGRRHYPIPYPIGRIFSYIVLAYGVYFISKAGAGYLAVLWSRVLFNSLLFALFLWFLYRWEKSSILSWIEKN